MKFPWVSRERLDEVQRRLDAAEQERWRLLDLLLPGIGITGSCPPLERLPAEAPATAAGTGAEPESETKAPPTVEAFSTPFDRIEKRFERAFQKGTKIPAEFRARL
jgi:hypothetical protein